MVVTVGLTDRELPLPSGVPPHELLYHCHEAPVPSEPPDTESVVLLPAQMVVAVAVASGGAVDTLLTVTVTVAQAVVLQGPSARTK